MPGEHGWWEFGTRFQFRERCFFLLFLSFFLNRAAHGAGGVATECAVQGLADTLACTALLKHGDPCPGLGQHQMPVEHAESGDEA